MKKLYILFIFCIVIVLSGCNVVKQEYSKNLQADGKIVSVDYEDSGMSNGLDFNGKITFASVPESYKTVISWAHGPTTLDTAEDYNKFLEYKGRNVEIIYSEVYQTVYDSKTEKLISKTITGYKIIDIKIIPS